MEACSALIKVTGSTDPQAEAKRIYTKSYPMYGKLYKSLKSDFVEIAKIAEDQAKSNVDAQKGLLDVIKKQNEMMAAMVRFDGARHVLFSDVLASD